MQAWTARELRKTSGALWTSCKKRIALMARVMKDQNFHDQPIRCS